MSVPELSPACLDCPTSLRSYETTGGAVVCSCGVVYASDDFVWPTDDRPSRPAPEVPRDSRVQVVRVGDLAARTPVRLLRPVEDAELVRVRRVLYELRPERGGPLGGDTPASVPEPRPSVPTRGGGLGADVPRDAFSRPSPRSPGAVAADRVEALRRVDGGAAETLHWMQRAGSLEGGLGALYRRAGQELADATKRARWALLSDTLRHEAERATGRARVLHACDVWER